MGQIAPKHHKKLNIDMTDAHTQYQSGLNNHAFFKTSNHALGQDLVQDTFLKTWKYLVKGGKIDIMKAFLYHVLNDLIIDEYRKRKPESLDVLIKKGFEPSVNEVPKLINTLDGRAALLLIGLLPLKYQKVMRMRYVQDLSLKEMSDINGQTQNANAVQIHRGTEMMRSLNENNTTL